MKSLEKIACLALVICLLPVSAMGKKIPISTAVVSATSAHKELFPWGSLITYYSGETHGTKDALSAVAIVKPGMEIHPPHVHSEEEYLMVVEGSGTWTLGDKDSPASIGDMLYAAPWDLHGIKNTGKTDLKFVVFKWNSKAVLPKMKKK